MGQPLQGNLSSVGGDLATQTVIVKTLLRNLVQLSV